MALEKYLFQVNLFSVIKTKFPFLKEGQKNQL